MEEIKDSMNWVQCKTWSDFLALCLTQLIAAVFALFLKSDFTKLAWIISMWVLRKMIAMRITIKRSKLHWSSNSIIYSFQVILLLLLL